MCFIFLARLSISLLLVRYGRRTAQTNINSLRYANCVYAAAQFVVPVSVRVICECVCVRACASASAIMNEVQHFAISPTWLKRRQTRKRSLAIEVAVEIIMRSFIRDAL